MDSPTDFVLGIVKRWQYCPGFHLLLSHIRPISAVAGLNFFKWFSSCSVVFLGNCIPQCRVVLLCKCNCELEVSVVSIRYQWSLWNHVWSDNIDGSSVVLWNPVLTDNIDEFVVSSCKEDDVILLFGLVEYVLLSLWNWNLRHLIMVLIIVVVERDVPKLESTLEDNFPSNFHC